MGQYTAKSKRDLNYRKAEFKSDERCANCSHFREKHPVYKLDGTLMDRRPRCEPIGLGSSRKYNIRPVHVCDAFKERDGA